MIVDKTLVHQLIDETLDPLRDLLNLMEFMPEDETVPAFAFTGMLRTALEAAQARVESSAGVCDKYALAFFAKGLTSKHLQ